MLTATEKIKGGLVVSCQALAGEPLEGAKIMAKMALAAAQGGAAGIRANSPEDIREIKKITDLPLIGIYKKNCYDSPIYITPTIKEAKEIAQAGADIIAIEATKQKRPNDLSLKEYIRFIHDSLELPVMADISVLEEGIEAWKSGADLVATTLSGYTNYSKNKERPDFELLAELVKTLKIPVVMEGGVETPEEAKRALDIGAHSVVVGSAITRPKHITSRFAKKIINFSN